MNQPGSTVLATHCAAAHFQPAKAMIVTRSRLHAVHYNLALDAYLREQGYTFKTLVAFPCAVHDGGLDVTEANMNGIPDTQTSDTFAQDEYRFLVVANKFQTGFDQPLLHTMNVDKKLGGVHALRTLSRLNRTELRKNETVVLDLANEADEIQQAFGPYYELRAGIGLFPPPNPRVTPPIQMSYLLTRLSTRRKATEQSTKRCGQKHQQCCEYERLDHETEHGFLRFGRCRSASPKFVCPASQSPEYDCLHPATIHNFANRP